MPLFFIVPDFHDRPTGGNIYNRRIVTELRKSYEVRVESWNPDTTASPPSPPSPTSAVVLDSLLARRDDALLPFRRQHAGPLVLLAHYLHCIDPRTQTTAAAHTERAVLPLFDGIVTSSRFAQRALVQDGVAPDCVSAVPPGLDDAYRRPLPDRSGPPPELLTVASWLPGKGLATLIEQLDTLADLDWRWTLVGDDTLDSEFAAMLRARLQDASIAARVTTTGPVSPEAMRTHYDDADLFVLPSRFETCSMATREAMARGLPVVGYDVGGMAENFGDAEAGRLVPPDHPPDFADALRRLLVKPASRSAMSRAARTRSEAFPTWATAAARVHSFLQALY